MHFCWTILRLAHSLSPTPGSSVWWRRKPSNSFPNSMSISSFPLTEAAAVLHWLQQLNANCKTCNCSQRRNDAPADNAHCHVTPSIDACYVVVMHEDNSFRDLIFVVVKKYFFYFYQQGKLSALCVCSKQLSGGWCAGMWGCTPGWFHQFCWIAVSFLRFVKSFCSCFQCI